MICGDGRFLEMSVLQCRDAVGESSGEATPHDLQEHHSGHRSATTSRYI